MEYLLTEVDVEVLQNIFLMNRKWYEKEIETFSF